MVKIRGLLYIKDNRPNNLTRILFAVYILMLVWIILFKMSFSIDELYKNRRMNIMPFMDWGILKQISVGFFISLGIEVLQFNLAIGATDITDFIEFTHKKYSFLTIDLIFLSLP